jgi:hypothetical protein
VLTLALAFILNSAPVATIEERALVAIYSHQGAMAERSSRTEEIVRWLDRLDGERIRAASTYSPFADETTTIYPNPFDQE